MVDISPTAVAEIERLKNQQEPDVCLRLTVKSGGCLDFFYNLTFELKSPAGASESEKSDRSIEVQGIELVVDEQSWTYIQNLQLDYAEDLMGGGFRYNNPQYKKTCGCGISFARSA